MGKLYLGALVFVLCTGCSMLRDSPKTEFKDGFYRQKNNGRSKTVYVNSTDDDIVVYPAVHRGKDFVIDSTAKPVSYKTETKKLAGQVISFKKNSFDFDFLTIPVKLRFHQKGLPAQLNANINGAAYIGYRSDFYKLSYDVNPLKKAERNSSHYGYSYGVFSGFGNTLMNPTNTNSMIVKEYDGIVWSKGIAGFIAVDNFTIGLTFGDDNLMDSNRKYWLYENKIWTGLALGLNLN